MQNKNQYVTRLRVLKMWFLSFKDAGTLWISTATRLLNQHSRVTYRCYIKGSIPHMCELGRVLWMSWAGYWNLFQGLQVFLPEMWNGPRYGIPVIKIITTWNEVYKRSNIWAHIGDKKRIRMAWWPATDTNLTQQTLTASGIRYYTPSHTHKLQNIDANIMWHFRKKQY